MAFRTVALLALALCCLGQNPVEWVCPMDPDVRSKVPAKCPRCGMKLVAGIPDAAEYPVQVSMSPRAPHPGDTVTLHIHLRDAKDRHTHPKLQTIHEKLLHLFVVSNDLQFFAHEHPVLQPDGSFLWSGKLPKAGEYRLLCDFYPEGGTPQMIARTIIIPGANAAAMLQPDMTPKEGANVRVSLTTEPAQPLAGQKTMLFFQLEPSDGLQPYLGAWGHMLAASSDGIDMIHTHPAFEERGSKIQFNLIFPRPGLHRVWVQFQRDGIVNTVAFNIPVASL